MINFLKQLEGFGQNPFFLKGEDIFSYEELRKAVENASIRLKKAGVLRGQYVPILMEASLEYLTALLAVFTVGACAVPLDIVSMTENEICDVVKSLEAHLVITAPDYSMKAGRAAEDIVKLDWRSLSEEASQNKINIQSMDDLPPDSEALILFSSGSNGRPKGVVRSYRAVSAQIKALSKAYSIGTEDLMLCTARPQHSYGLENVLAALYGGAAICFQNASEYNLIREKLADSGVTVFAGVPIIYEILAKIRKRPVENSRLRLALSAGAPLSEEINRDFEKTYKIPVTQVYGSSEAPSCTANLKVASNREYLSVGQPIPGVEIKILNEGGEELPADTVGELWVKSPFASHCYLNQPELTKTHFAGKWYRTGDLGYRSEDGLLFLCGKIKSMINVAGNKVNPEEVEALLSTYPGVKDVLVSGIPDKVYGEMVKAVVVAEEGVVITEVELLKFCQGKVADFKVPRVIEYSTCLERTATGKLKREKM
ncbi:MAG TPA: class I adenylate-forming enzyme family protein [Ruminiclostridium sp.]|nr:class I adenylate-forming enzyme family protein [Ruminiclostridium sp.]